MAGVIKTLPNLYIYVMRLSINTFITITKTLTKPFSRIQTYINCLRSLGPEFKRCWGGSFVKVW
jgi:hypothetical protein